MREGSLRQRRLRAWHAVWSDNLALALVSVVSESAQGVVSCGGGLPSGSRTRTLPHPPTLDLGWVCDFRLREEIRKWTEMEAALSAEEDKLDAGQSAGQSFQWGPDRGRGSCTE